MKNNLLVEDGINFPQKTLLTTKEVAVVLGLSVITLRRLASQGKILSYKPNGKNLFFLYEDVFAYVTQYKRNSIEAFAILAAFHNYKNRKK